MTKPSCRSRFNFIALNLLVAMACGPASAWAAACCGGGVSLPAIIVGDEAAKLSAAYSETQILSDVDSDGVWYPRDHTEMVENFKLDAAKIFADRWQVGASLPIIRRTLADESSTGFGDISTVLGYEILPDWDYNPWRPHGLAFVDVIAPTGVSNDTSSAPYSLDVRGRGFWSMGVGTVLTKVIAGQWDTLASLEIHRSFQRSVNLGSSEGATRVTLKPGYGGLAAVGGGYSQKLWRVGLALSWLYEDPIETVGVAAGEAQRATTATISGHYLFANEYSMNLAVADQTLFGEPANTTLGRSITLSVEKHWLR